MYQGGAKTPRMQMQPRSNCNKCHQWLSMVLGMPNSLACLFLLHVYVFLLFLIMGLCSQPLTSRVSHPQTQSTVEPRKCLEKNWTYTDHVLTSLSCLIPLPRVYHHHSWCLQCIGYFSDLEMILRIQKWMGLRKYHIFYVRKGLE